jgi:hypothetical protein
MALGQETPSLRRRWRCDEACGVIVAINTLRLQEMRLMRWLVFGTGIALIVVRGFWSNIFMIDAFTVVILFVLSIPFVAQYLRKAKFPGAEFEFKDEIRETEKLVQLSIEQTKASESSRARKTLQFETFKLTTVKGLLDSDPVLALAALRIEIERTLTLMVTALSLSVSGGSSVTRLIKAFSERQLLSSVQVAALQKIVSMCTKAIHGSFVSEAEARRIIDLAEELNRTFSTGYSIDFSLNSDYEKQGLLCEWEHCIEWMPLSAEPTKVSCPVFGHDCPGGEKAVSLCDKRMDDLPTSRFAKNPWCICLI